MNFAAPLVLALLLLGGCRTVAAGWELVHDETFEASQGPDAAFWNYEQGFVRNNELQYYVSGTGPALAVSDSALVFTASAVAHPNKAYQPGSADWRTVSPTAAFTSASIRSKQSFQNGRFEVTARVPDVAGTWPAIWLIGRNRGVYGEVDLMEHLGRTPGTIHTTVHQGRTANQRGARHVITPVKSAASVFHTYTAELTPLQVRLYIDRRLVLSLPRLKPTRDGLLPLVQPFQLVINLALGGWGGAPDLKRLPAAFEVRSIRIWRWVNGQTKGPAA